MKVRGPWLEKLPYALTSRGSRCLLRVSFVDSPRLVKASARVFRSGVGFGQPRIYLWKFRGSPTKGVGRGGFGFWRLSLTGFVLDFERARVIWFPPS